MKMINRKYKLRKLSIGLVSVGTMFMTTAVAAEESVNSNNTNSAQTSVTNSNVTADNSSSSTTTKENDATLASSETAEKTKEELNKPQVPAPIQSDSSNTEASNKEPLEGTPTQDTANRVERVEVKSETIEIDNYKVDNEKSDLTVTDGQGRDKVIKNRDDEKREIFDLHREVVDNQDGTLEVTLTVNPKEIDKGEEVIVLLDTSQKMKEEDFKTAKENIKKLVTTLTANPSNQNHNSRNSVRLINFYRKVNDPLELTTTNVDNKLEEVWKKAKEDYNWGVDLQGAIHKAREVFNKEKGNGKRQHIVLFSQGEATFSYDIKSKNDDNNIKQTRIDGKITSSNPLFPWLPVFNHTNQNADMIKDLKKFASLAKELGINGLSDIETLLNTAGIGSVLLGNVLGGGSLTEYFTLKEYDSKALNEEQFDYNKRIGEGYHHHSFSERKTKDMPYKHALPSHLDKFFKKDNGNVKTWFESILDTVSLTDYYNQTKKDALLKVLEYLFYKREYIYYNHNLSAQAEAKMARDEGITFYAFDVTDSNRASKELKSKDYSKAYTDYLKKKEEDSKKFEEERNKKFDAYLKSMSEDNKFIDNLNDKEKFKDILTKIIIKDEFTDNVNVEKNSWQTHTFIDTNNVKQKYPIEYNSISSSWLFGPKPESLTWTISKDDLQKAFEESKPLTLTYKLTVDKEKLKAKGNSRKKRDLSSDSNVPISKNIISNTISYTINDKKVNAKKLDDVNLIYSKERLVKKIVNETKREVLTFKTQEFLDNRLPKGQRVLATKGENGSITSEFQHTYIGDRLTDSKLLIKITKNPRHEVIRVGTKATALANENLDIISGQSDPISITEDTQPGMSGQADHARLIEESSTEHNNLVVGHQSEPVDITEDSQPNMSGSNEGGVIEEETDLESILQLENKESDNDSELPQKAIIEEDKEFPQITTLKEAKKVTQIPQMAAKVAGQTPQAPITQSEHQLPQTRDKETSCEAFFTMTALAIIGAAGLVNKKRYDKHID